MTQLCCSHFGNGMAELVQGSGFGEKHIRIGTKFNFEHKRLASLPGISIEYWVLGDVWYFDSYVNTVFILLILSLDIVEMDQSSINSLVAGIMAELSP